jgi:hypothetical protein
VAGEDHTAPGQDQPRRRYTVAEAAEMLGITAEAVRTRIKRRKLDSVKEPDAPGGTVYVLLPDQTGPNIDPTVKGQDQTRDQTGLLEELRDRVRYLERQVEEEREARRRADTILAQLSRANEEQARTIRAIEAPDSGGTEPRESPESRGPSHTPPDAGGEAQEAAERQEERKGFFRRFFGL